MTTDMSYFLYPATGELFEPFARDIQANTEDTTLVPPDLADQLISLHVQQYADNYLARLGMDPEAAFEAEQNRLFTENATQPADHYQWQVDHLPAYGPGFIDRAIPWPKCLPSLASQPP